MIFDGTIASFEITTHDDLTFESYFGSFKVKCFLSPLEIIRTDRIYRELIGPVNSMMAGEDAKTFAFAISQLSVRVVDSPEFFKNSQNPELNGGHLPQKVLVDILNKAIDAETKFREDQKKKYEDTQKRLTSKIKSGKIKKKLDDEQEEIEDGN